MTLHQKGHRVVGRQHLRTVICRRNLHALQPEVYTPRTTDSTHGLRYAPNRLLDQSKPTQANRVWISDTTHLPLATGSCAYLCAFQDVASKDLIGWHTSRYHARGTHHYGLAADFLDQPLTPSLVMHSDRGG